MTKKDFIKTHLSGQEPRCGMGELRPLQIVELFSGIGAFSKALANLGIPYERVAMCEIDPHAIKVYEALHGPTPNLGDISRVEHLPDCDLLTYSFPCQDISNAGKKQGMSKGSDTRSGLLWEVERLLLDAREREGDGQNLPRHLVMENVDAILHKTNISVFETWIQSLTKIGYASSYAILNACNYGVPQNRKRCFMISSLGHDRLVFPQPCPDGRVLKDILEDDVPDKFYLSEKAMEGLKAHKARHDAKGHGFGFRITDPAREKAGSVTAKSGWRNTDTFIEDQGSPGQKLLHVADLPTSYETSGRAYSANGLSPTINTCGGGDKVPKMLIEGGKMNEEQNGIRSGTGTVTPDLRIRRLTPRECWRLQGFGDDDFEIAKNIGTSDSQLYKQAGNSIAVPCLEAILRAMYIDKAWISMPSLDLFAKEE